MTQAPTTPWLIPFQRKDLLAACWGGGKEADLLYHFLHKASWEAKNNNLETSMISFKEEHDKILKDVPMAEGTLITYIKRFNLAGYISSGRYGNAFTVNVEAIQAAFTNPPAKPLSAPRGRPKGSKVSRIKRQKNIKTSEEIIETLENGEVSMISEPEEVLILKEKVLSLESEVLILKEKVLILEPLILKLKLSKSNEIAPQDTPEAKVSSQNDLEKIQNDLEDKEREATANAALASAAADEDELIQSLLSPAQELRADVEKVIDEVEQAQFSLQQQDQKVETSGNSVVSAHRDIDLGSGQNQRPPASANSHSQSKGSGSGKGKKQAFTRSVTTAQLTLEGSQIFDWYGIIRASKIRRTAQNITACNNLAECDGMSFETLKEAIEHWEEDKWVQSHGIVIDLQELEKPDGKFTFERAMTAIRTKQARSAPKQPAATQPNRSTSGKQRLDAAPRGLALTGGK